MATPTTTRTVTLPALLYVLAAFGVVTGSYGAVTAITTIATFVKPHDEYQKIVQARNETLKAVVGAAEIEYYTHEAEARYARRNSALPLAGVELILSCLMFAGAMRAMRADGWGLAAWSFAAAASIPYQLVSLTLTLVMARDLSSATAALPPMERFVASHAPLAAIGFCGLSVLYYGVCVIYLRTPTVRRAFSDGAARTPPSA